MSECMNRTKKCKYTITYGRKGGLYLKGQNGQMNKAEQQTFEMGKDIPVAEYPYFTCVGPEE